MTTTIQILNKLVEINNEFSKKTGVTKLTITKEKAVLFHFDQISSIDFEINFCIKTKKLEQKVNNVVIDLDYTSLNNTVTTLLGFKEIKLKLEDAKIDLEYALKDVENLEDDLRRYLITHNLPRI